MIMKMFYDDRFFFFCRCLFLLFLLLISTPPVIVAQNTCTFDGIVFQDGESLGSSFETRCGPATEYPCYCNPALSPTTPVSCPYCGLAVQGGDLVCARDGESVTIVDIQGIQQDCSCLIDNNGMPQSTCQESTTNTNNPQNPPTDPPTTSSIIDDDDVCILEYSDGSTIVFQDGESFGLLIDSPCPNINQYPCYCNVDLPGKIDCPYCQYTNNFDLTICGVVGEMTNFLNPNGMFKSCTCLDDLTSTCDNDPIITPAPQEQQQPPPTPAPQQNNMQTPNPNTPPSSSNTCIIENPNDDGTTIVFQDGESYGDFVTSPCENGPQNQYPCYCNPGIPTQIECPYCLYTNRFDEIICGDIGETSVFQNIYDETKVCTCYDDLTTSCDDDPTPSPAPVPPPTKIPTIAPVVVPTTSSPTSSNNNQLPTFDKPTILIPNRPPMVPTLPPGCIYTNPITGQLDVVAEGEIFDVDTTGVIGPCQPHEEWHVFCNTQIPTQREYPYCVFDATTGGGSSATTTRTTRNKNDEDDVVICARPDEEIVVPQSDGTIANCACVYLNPLIGVVSNCPMVVVDLWDDGPIVPPTSASPSSVDGMTSRNPSQSPAGGSGDPSSESSDDESSSSFTFVSKFSSRIQLFALFLIVVRLWI